MNARKTWRLLLEAGEKLRDAGVAPASWVAWSFDVWKSYGHSQNPPSMAWTFAAKRVDGDLDWYRHEGYDTLGGLVVMGEIERSFVHRDAAMREAAFIYREIPVESVIAHFFPDGYAQALKAAEHEAERTRARIAQRLSDGDWLWG